MAIRYLSLFSGIEAATVAWEPLGWQCVAVAEIDPFPCAVLAHHYPDVPNLGDVSGITVARLAALGRIDIVVGGSPCQDLSVAGKRAGLAGERSGLFHEQLRIFHAARTVCGARFLLWENVPGAFSTHGGRDFAVVVGAMAGGEFHVPEDGWGNEGVALGENGLLEWGVLDAQWFGVAQRRRRVFGLLDTGDWSGRPPILLEPESLRGDSAPRRVQGEETPARALRSSDGGIDREDGHTLVCATLDARFGRLQGCNGQDANRGHSHLIAFGGNRTSGPIEVAPALLAHPGGGWKGDFESETFVTHDLRSGGGGVRESTLAVQEVGRPTHGQSQPAHGGMQVRRLTVEECEFLQGFPRSYTAIPWRKKPATDCPDGPRYKALGNSMAVPVMRWIGLQIQRAVEYGD